MTGIRARESCICNMHDQRLAWSVLREVPRRLVHCHVEAGLGVRPALVVSTYEGEDSFGSSLEVGFQHTLAVYSALPRVVIGAERPSRANTTHVLLCDVCYHDVS